MTQLGQAKPLTEALGFRCIEKPGFEADDIMATMARKAVKNGWDAVLVTGDKDALQLVGPGMRVFNVSKEAWMDPPQIEEKFGISFGGARLSGDRRRLLRQRARTQGRGPVGAVKLIKTYGSLKGAIAAAKKGRQGAHAEAGAGAHGREKRPPTWRSPSSRSTKGCRSRPSAEDCRVKIRTPISSPRASRSSSSARCARPRRHASTPGRRPAPAPAPSVKGPAAAATLTIERSSSGPSPKDLAKAKALLVVAVPDSAGEGELLSVSRVRVGLGLEDGRMAVLDEHRLKENGARFARGTCAQVRLGPQGRARALDVAGFELAGPDFDYKLAAYCLDRAPRGIPRTATPRRDRSGPRGAVLRPRGRDREDEGSQSSRSF